MTEVQVKAILGEPAQIEPWSNEGTKWCYSADGQAETRYRLGNNNIAAAAEFDRNGKLSRWEEPYLKATAEPKAKSSGTAIVGELVPPGYDRTPWRKLHVGMGKDEVRKVMGEPLRLDAQSGITEPIEVWYYFTYPLQEVDRGIGQAARGTLEFQSGNLARWREP